MTSLSPLKTVGDDLQLNVFIVDQLDEHFVFQRFVLSAHVHRRVADRRDVFFVLLLVTSLVILLGDQVIVGGHAEVVVLEGRRVSE